jgi:hypothetical protein
MAVVLGFVAIATVTVIEANGGALLYEPERVLHTIGRGVRWFEGLGPEAFALLAGVGVWWRGSRWAQRRLRFSEVFASFRWGAIVVSLAALTEGLLSWPLRGTLVALPFFAVSLWALVLAHLSEVYPKAADDRRWHIASLGTVGLILLFGITFNRPNLLGFWNLTQIGGFIGGVADRVALILILPFAWITQFITAFFSWLLGGLVRTPMRFGRLDLIPDNLPSPANAGPNVAGWVLTSVKALLVVGAILLVAWLLFRSFRWFRMRQQEEDVLRESVSADTTIAQDLNDWLKNLLRRLERAPGSLMASLPEGLSAAALRALYRNLMLLAASRGQPRPEWATPFEYRQRLRDKLPNEEVSEITAAFVASRYGEHLPSQDTWRRLRRQWDRLRGEARAAEARETQPRR